jgi:hypothetical protein
VFVGILQVRKKWFRISDVISMDFIWGFRLGNGDCTTGAESKNSRLAAVYGYVSTNKTRKSVSVIVSEIETEDNKVHSWVFI